MEINKITVSGIINASILAGIIGGNITYYMYENKKQICEKDFDNNIFIDDSGNIKCYFDIGEHIIEVSRNDAYGYQSYNIEGYTIKNVEINGWRDNNVITYVNTEPVIVELTNDNNGKLEFNDFGKVEKENIKVKSLKKDK